MKGYFRNVLMILITYLIRFNITLTAFYQKTSNCQSLSLHGLKVAKEMLESSMLNILYHRVIERPEALLELVVSVQKMSITHYWRNLSDFASIVKGSVCFSVCLFADIFKTSQLSQFSSYLHQIILITSCDIKGRLPSKVVFCQRSSSVKGHLPLMVIFCRWSCFV